MYYRIASFAIDPSHEKDFLEIAERLRVKLKNTDEPPFIDYLKIEEQKAMIIISYENQNLAHEGDVYTRDVWSELQESQFVTGPLIISEGAVSWML